jgi:hypothetical protein
MRLGKPSQRNTPPLYIRHLLHKYAGPSSVRQLIAGSRPQLAALQSLLTNWKGRTKSVSSVVHANNKDGVAPLLSVFRVNR